MILNQNPVLCMMWYNERSVTNRNVRFNDSVFGLAVRYDLELVDDLIIILPRKIKLQSRTCFIKIVSENVLPTDATPHLFPESTHA